MANGNRGVTNYMKYRNNLRNISKTLMLCIFIISVLLGCNQIKSENSKTNTINNNNQEKPNKLLENSYNGEWQQIARLRYIKGTIVSLVQSLDGRYILNLKVEFNFHSETDPVGSPDYPFKIGNVVEFTLKDKPKVNLSDNERIIVYQGQVTTDGKNDFLGADIKYYEKQGKYFDINGKEIIVPPQDYPSSL
jgi:hypothetical protein